MTKKNIAKRDIKKEMKSYKKIKKIVEPFFPKQSTHIKKDNSSDWKSFVTSNSNIFDKSAY